MNRVLEYIEKRKQPLTELPLFAFVQDRSIEPRIRLGFAPCLAPMTMGFADLMVFGLRDTHSQNKIQQVLNAHTAVDDHHWQFYLQDLATLGVSEPLDLVGGLKMLYGKHSAKARQLIYQVMGMVRAASHPIVRMVILEAIEAAADIGFSRFRQVGSEFTQQTGKPLYYFGEQHQDIEDEHEAMGAQSIKGLISAHEWTPEQEREALQMVDEVVTCFAEMGGELLAYALKAREQGHLWPVLEAPPATK